MWAGASATVTLVSGTCIFVCLLGSSNVQVGALCIGLAMPGLFSRAADQLWGIIARRLASESKLLDPDDAVSCIARTLNLHTVKAWLGKNTLIEVSRMETVHDWRNHLPLFMVGLEGGLLVDSTANHLYVMMRRRGVLCVHESSNSKRVGQ